MKSENQNITRQGSIVKNLIKCKILHQPKRFLLQCMLMKCVVKLYLTDPMYFCFTRVRGHGSHKIINVGLNC